MKQIIRSLLDDPRLSLLTGHWIRLRLKSLPSFTKNTQGDGDVVLGSVSLHDKNSTTQRLSKRTWRVPQVLKMVDETRTTQTAKCIISLYVNHELFWCGAKIRHHLHSYNQLLTMGISLRGSISSVQCRYFQPRRAIANLGPSPIVILQSLPMVPHSGFMGMVGAPHWLSFSLKLVTPRSEF